MWVLDQASALLLGSWTCMCVYKTADGKQKIVSSGLESVEDENRKKFPFV